MSDVRSISTTGSPGYVSIPGRMDSVTSIIRVMMCATLANDGTRSGPNAE